MCLKNKNILFFAPAFFGYEYKIKREMVCLGANVDLFDERSIKSAFHRALLKISPKIFKHRTNNYYSKIYKLLNLYNIVIFIHLYILNFILVRVFTLI